MEDNLMRYFATRERQRAQAVEETLAAMTERERRLVREAAIMGHVRGMMRAGALHMMTPSPDSAVLFEVVSACLAAPDLYPVTKSLTDTEENDRG